MAIKVLTEQALGDYIGFDDSESCSCHINPPCSKCTDAGNPACLIDDETAWVEITESEYESNPDGFETFEDVFKKAK